MEECPESGYEVIELRGVTVEVFCRPYYGAPNWFVKLPGGIRCHTDSPKYEPMPSEYPALMSGSHRTRQAALECAERQLEAIS